MYYSLYHLPFFFSPPFHPTPPHPTTAMEQNETKQIVTEILFYDRITIHTYPLYLFLPFFLPSNYIIP